MHPTAYSLRFVSLVPPSTALRLPAAGELSRCAQSGCGGLVVFATIEPMEIEVLGLDHVYITVADMFRSEVFYDKVMKVLGFRKVIRPIGHEPHVHYFNRCMRSTIRPTASTRFHDQNSPGLHHLCFQVRDQSSVDAAAKLLRQSGVEVSEPRLYLEYTPDYYATFFHNPDGIELEIVNRLEARDEAVENWDRYKLINEKCDTSTMM